MRHFALLLMAFAAFWIGAPACAHGSQNHDATAKTHHHAHHNPHDGLAQACAGCALPAVVPDASVVMPIATRRSVLTAEDVVSLASLGPDAQAPPPRFLA